MSERYFVITSDNCGEINNEMYGYCLTEQGIYTKYRKELDQLILRGGCKGAFVLIHKSENITRIVRDSMGLVLLYCLRFENY